MFEPIWFGLDLVRIWEPCAVSFPCCSSFSILLFWDLWRWFTAGSGGGRIGLWFGVRFVIEIVFLCFWILCVCCCVRKLFCRFMVRFGVNLGLGGLLSAKYQRVGNEPSDWPDDLDSITVQRGKVAGQTKQGEKARGCTVRPCTYTYRIMAALYKGCRSQILSFCLVNSLSSLLSYKNSPSSLLNFLQEHDECSSVFILPTQKPAREWGFRWRLADTAAHHAGTLYFFLFYLVFSSTSSFRF